MKKSIQMNCWSSTVPWTNAEHILSATNADLEQAELLSLAERDALFVIQRRTWLKENLVTMFGFIIQDVFIKCIEF